MSRFRPFVKWARPAALSLILSLFAFSASASVSIPVGDTAYDDLERLEVKGLVKSPILSTKPFGRLEGARLAREARDIWETLPESEKKRLGGAYGIIERLEGEFSDELSTNRPEVSVKPLDKAYGKLVYSDKSPYFQSVNNRGDSFAGGFNLRAGFASKAELFDTISLYLEPKFGLDKNDSKATLQEGYAKLDLYGAELTVGKEAMWWGPGAHGDLLVTDNAKPLEMLRLTSGHPFLLPWIFGYLGPIKPTVFLTRLEKDRDFPRANLLGMRLDLKPLPGFSIGFSRVFLFGGEGRRSLSASEWLKVFFASDSAEHADSPINGDQIASIDGSFVYVNRIKWVPFSGVKIYTDWGAEDSSGKSRTPTGRASIYGFFVDEPLWLKDFDLRAEWANTARNARYGPAWYTHGIYTTGYTYEGKVIGHHMGSDSKDYFVKLRRHLSPGAYIAVEADRETSGVHGSSPVRRDWIAADFRHPVNGILTVYGGAGLEKIKETNAPAVRNPSAWAGVECYF